MSYFLSLMNSIPTLKSQTFLHGVYYGDIVIELPQKED